MSTPAVRPADRYGDRSPGSWRWLWPALAGVLMAGAAGWVILWAASDPVRGSLVGWEDPAGGVMPVTLEVVRPAGVAVTCDLVAVDLRRVVVGQTGIEIAPEGDQRVRIRAEIPLEADAVAPQLRGCAAVAD
ncbi:MAG TPA: DUF4307 domain-containing protein [Jiangellaceae bacterium]|nr:DUF4307 domain-containing protein [Jiangellaceae bacterium]